MINIMGTKFGPTKSGVKEFNSSCGIRGQFVFPGRPSRSSRDDRGPVAKNRGRSGSGCRIGSWSFREEQ